MFGELVLSGCAPVDGAYNGHHCRALLPESGCGVENCAACGDHVFDEKYLPSSRVATLGKLQGSVRLGFLSDEQRRDFGEIAQNRRQRDAAEFESSKHVGFGRDERNHATDDPVQQDWVGLEQVLVEVLVRNCSRPEDEVSV